MTENKLRADLPPLPERMRGLPVDERGYPVPFFVAYIDGKPDFRVMDSAKYRDAIRFRKCWLCGGPLGRFATFVAGPMCGVNRTSSEPPSHLECARYAACACPFLTRPKATRRDAGMPIEKKIVGGVSIDRNPGVALLWTSRSFFMFGDGRGGRLFNMGDPASVEWYAEGRPATREEVVTSIESGLPILVDATTRDPLREAAMDELRARLAFMQPLLPAPAAAAGGAR